MPLPTSASIGTRPLRPAVRGAPGGSYTSSMSRGGSSLPRATPWRPPRPWLAISTSSSTVRARPSRSAISPATWARRRGVIVPRGLVDEVARQRHRRGDALAARHAPLHRRTAADDGRPSRPGTAWRRSCRRVNRYDASAAPSAIACAARPFSSPRGAASSSVVASIRVSCHAAFTSAAAARRSTSAVDLLGLAHADRDRRVVAAGQRARLTHLSLEAALGQVVDVERAGLGPRQAAGPRTRGCRARRRRRERRR